MRGVTVDGATVDRIVYARLADDLPAHEPEGFRALLNSFLPRKRAISQMLVRDQDGRVLLCRLTYKQDWDLPGGVVEVGESPQLAVAREVEEELGARSSRPAGCCSPTGCRRGAAGTTRSAWSSTAASTTPRSLDGIVRQEREIRDAAFCTLDEVARAVRRLHRPPDRGGAGQPGRRRSGVHRVGARLRLPMARSRHVCAVRPGARSTAWTSTPASS